ncbi:MAG: hypothetical protein AAGA80_24820 [Cyanobacteria bacterium P01_F01_bin.143]
MTYNVTCYGDRTNLMRSLINTSIDQKYLDISRSRTHPHHLNQNN